MRAAPVHVVPVFGESGALLEHAVFCIFYNWPLTIRRRMGMRASLREKLNPRYWHVAIVGFVGAAILGSVDAYLYETTGILPALKEVGWIMAAIAFAGGAAVTLGAGGVNLQKRIVAGAFFALFTDITYESRLILTSFFSFLGVLVGVYWGKPTEEDTLKAFILIVNPIGFWPDRSFKQSIKELSIKFLEWVFICLGLILLLTAFHKLIFIGGFLLSLLLLFSGGLLIYLATSRIAKLKNLWVPH